MKYTINQWIDEIQILTTAEKNIRKETARELQADMEAFFSGVKRDIEGGAFLTAFPSDYYLDDLFAIYLSFADDPDDPWMLGKSRRWASEVEGATERAVFANMTDALRRSVEDGEKIPESEIPKKVNDMLSTDRALNIALQETNVINNYRHQQEIANTQTTKTWWTIMDEKTRIWHWEAYGQTVLVEEPFIVGGEELMFPGDDSLGASAENLINCRCQSI